MALDPIYHFVLFQTIPKRLIPSTLKLSKLIFEDMTKSVELIEKHLGFTPTKEEVEKINEVVKNFDSTKTDYLRMRNSKTQADEIKSDILETLDKINQIHTVSVEW